MAFLWRKIPPLQNRAHQRRPSKRPVAPSRADNNQPIINPVFQLPGHQHPFHQSRLQLGHELFHKSSFQFITILFINPVSTWPRIISSIELLVSRDLFHQSSFYMAMIAHELFLQSSLYLAMNYFIKPASSTSISLS